MKKVFFVLIALCSHFFTAHAQFKTQMSESFDEPNDGWNKLMQLKNGNTFFFHFSKKEGIEINVYDKNRKIIATQSLESELWEAKKMKVSQIEGLYEINGQPVIFLQQLLDHTPTLFRIVLDPMTGAKIKEDQLGELLPYHAFSAYAVAFGTDPNNSFVEKDPASDCYAVVYFNGFAHETDARIEVVHYDGNHKEINRAFYVSPQGKFKYLRYIGMTVDADKQVYLCTYGFNHGEEKDSRVIVSRLRKGEKEFSHNMLDLSADFKDTKAVMHYNPGTKKIQLLTLTFEKSKNSFFKGTSNYYLSLMLYIDPETLTVTDAKPLAAKMVNEKMINQFKKEDGYSGLPQNMIVNSDYSTTVLMEEMRKETVYQNGAVVSQKTILNNIGISELDKNGEEQQGYAILKSQMTKGIIPELYLAQKGNGYWSYGNSGVGQQTKMISLGGDGNTNAFMSFDYLNTKNASYILFNDAPKNIDKDETEKRTTIQSVSNTSTMCYTMKNGTVTRSYLFGDPGDEDKADFSYIESSNFMQETNTYATIMVEKIKRNKEAKIVWVTFE